MSETAPTTTPADTSKGYEGFDFPSEPAESQSYEGFDFPAAPAESYQGFGDLESGTPDAPAPTLAEFSDPTLADTLSKSEANEKPALKGLRNLAKKVVGTVVKNPKSSVGDMSHALHDQSALTDYRRGTDNITSGGFEDTGRYDASREGLLGALQAEANTENALRDNASAQEKSETLKAKGQSQSFEANYSDVSSAQSPTGENPAYSDSLIRDSAFAEGQRTQGDEAVAVANNELENLAAREATLKKELREKEANTLSEAQMAAIRQRNGVS